MKEASAVIERLTGVQLPQATLDREARRQGQRADQQRTQLDEQMRTGRGAEQLLPLPAEPFTLVIELDAWNLRERDDWGKSALKRAAGQEPQRWRWAYGGTCFRLEQRVESDGGRARILSRAGARENRWAAARWNPPAANTNAASNVRVSSAVAWVMKA